MEAVEAVEAKLRSVGSSESLGFLGLDALEGSAGADAVEDEVGVVIAFVTFGVEAEAAEAGIKLVLDSLSLGVTSAKPLILRFSAVFKSEANWC